MDFVITSMNKYQITTNDNMPGEEQITNFVDGETLGNNESIT